MIGTSFSEGFLSASSVQVSNPAEWISGNYDVGFFASSWDRRCISITGAATLSLQTSVLLLFEGKDSQGLRDAHDAILLEYLKSRSVVVVPVTGQSVDIANVWGKLGMEILRIAASRRKPLRVYIDLTTFPRIYALALLATCIRSGISTRVTVGYAEGRYPERQDGLTVLESFPFTGGRWTTVPVPFLEGQIEPQLSKFFYVSVGFEGAKIMRVIMREDPDRISLLFPKPGFESRYEILTKEANEELIERRRIPPDQVVYAAAGDAIGAWQALSKAGLERFDQENVYYLCCGTKTHSLAFALRAIVLGRPAVLYNVPERYGVVDVFPSGLFWRFDIDDVTAI
jgi:hypothetical protein